MVWTDTHFMTHFITIRILCIFFLSSGLKTLLSTHMICCYISSPMHYATAWDLHFCLLLLRPVTPVLSKAILSFYIIFWLYSTLSPNRNVIYVVLKLSLLSKFVVFYCIKKCIKHIRYQKQPQSIALKIQNNQQPQSYILILHRHTIAGNLLE